MDLKAVSAEDAEALVAIRIAAMRESLERVGRFDPQRARDRFLSGFAPEFTRFICIDEQVVGFVAVKPCEDAVLLENLYILPEHQGRGVGTAVLMQVFADADCKQLPVKVGALRGSDANRFYQQHGFVLVKEEEWDLYYIRHPKRS